ncbi:multidrug resistance protein MdtH [bacterium BMS3Bbin06]|nr:multidrug resistance protein MdtH [bacterium BMS3Bbin06]
MKSNKKKGIPSAVIALGFVSLLTDLSSEMIYPLLPVFLTSVLGAGAFAIGLIEGVAEMTASVLKIISGYITDRTGKRKSMVLAGYTLSSLMRPLIGIAAVWPQVLFFRFMDRVGKGVRTSPRDALIGDVTDRSIIGRAYGFHRAMDHAGAVLGPLVAVFLLKGMGLSLKTIFLLSIVPGLFVILIILFFVRERTEVPEGSGSLIAEDGEPRSGVRDFGRQYWLFIVSVFIFALGNSTDAFILLRLNIEGVGASTIAILWSGFHVVKMGSTWMGGRLSDRIGRKPMILSGWLYYALIYVLFALLRGEMALVSVFLLYGVSFGFIEPAERAWVFRLVPKELRGRAFGFYHGAVGVASLPASVIFGLIWQRWGYGCAFMTGAFLSVAAVAVLSGVKEK